MLDEDPAPPTLLQMGRSPKIFGPYLLRPNGCRDQDATWHGGSTRPRRLCVRWEARSPPQKGGGAPHQTFGPCLLWPKAGWIKIVVGMEVGLIPGDFTLDGDPVPFPQKGAEPLPNFRPISIVVKRLDASRCHLVRK